MAAVATRAAALLKHSPLAEKSDAPRGTRKYEKPAEFAPSVAVWAGPGVHGVETRVAKNGEGEGRRY